MIEQTECRSCGAAIYFVRTQATGALIPVNVTPDPKGNIVIVNDKAKILTGGMFEQAEGDRYKSHFVDCPAAARHRKAKRHR